MVSKMQEVKEHILVFPKREGEKQLNYYDRIAKECLCSTRLAQDACRQIKHDVQESGDTYEVYRKPWMTKAMRILGGFVSLYKLGALTGNRQFDATLLSRACESSDFNVPTVMQLYYLASKLDTTA